MANDAERQIREYRSYLGLHQIARGEHQIETELGELIVFLKDQEPEQRQVRLLDTFFKSFQDIRSRRS